MLPQRITEQNACDIATRWQLTVRVAEKLSCMAGRVPYGLSIISGHRSNEKQDALRAEGRPAARNDRSNHTRCPATAADVWPSVAKTLQVQAALGEAAVVCGLRWGGGSPTDPQTGIPSDWNHVDEGPRPPDAT